MVYNFPKRSIATGRPNTKRKFPERTQFQPPTQSNHGTSEFQNEPILSRKAKLNPNPLHDRDQAPPECDILTRDPEVLTQ